jgi:hypothetical protein
MFPVISDTFTMPKHTQTRSAVFRIPGAFRAEHLRYFRVWFSSTDFAFLIPQDRVISLHGDGQEP